MSNGTSDLLNVTRHNAIAAPPVVKVITDDYTVPTDKSGIVVMIGTDAKTITLPAVSAVAPGYTVTVINIGGDGNNIVTVSPSGDDGVKGSLPASAGGNADATTADGLVSKASGTDGADIVNTKNTANEGDRITLVADGDADWFIAGGVGIWASAS